MIPVSAIPTPAELSALAVLIPTYFRLEWLDDEVVLTLNAPHDPTLPLVSYVIQRGTQRDYAGPLLSALVDEMAGQVVLHYRALRDSPDSPLLRILQIVNDPPLLVNQRIAPHGELKASTKTIHSAEADEWFPDGAEQGME